MHGGVKRCAWFITSDREQHFSAKGGCMKPFKPEISSVCKSVWFSTKHIIWKSCGKQLKITETRCENGKCWSQKKCRNAFFGEVAGWRNVRLLFQTQRLVIGAVWVELRLIDTFDGVFVHVSLSFKQLGAEQKAKHYCKNYLRYRRLANFGFYSKTESHAAPSCSSAFLVWNLVRTFLYSDQI